MVLKYIGIGILVLIGLVLIFFSVFVWINTREVIDNEELINELPGNISARYTSSDQWWKETTIYQIYPRSFKDSNGDGIGDIAGIISKLDYIKSVGFETIWISPFFKSPQKDHGYDVSDYLDIANEYGDQILVDSLISEVHRRGMRIVFDLVLNHTSDQHPWFKESRSSRENPKEDWYVWMDGKNGDPPNNWKSIAGPQSAWTYEPARDQWYYAAFLPFQPDLNMSNPEVKNEIFRIVRHWLDRGVDGFRLDIFNFIFEDSNYPDNPSSWRIFPDFASGTWMFEEHKYNFHQPDIIDFAMELRAILEEYSDGRFMIGEVFGSHRHMRELLGMERLDGLNLVFLFDFLEEFEFSANYFKEKLELYEEIYPSPLIPTYVFGNHDRMRSISMLQNDQRKAEVLAAFQLTVRGVPFVYQGEEIGMRTADIPLEEAQDPLAAGWLTFPGWARDLAPVILNRDNCRTPMQWDNTVSAGFSMNDQTWLPVQKNYASINVDSQSKDSGSLLTTYNELLELRNQSNALKKGDIEFMDNLPSGVLGFRRQIEDEEYLVYLNFEEAPKSISNNLDPEKIAFFRRSNFSENELGIGGFGIVIIRSRL